MLAKNSEISNLSSSDSPTPLNLKTAQILRKHLREHKISLRALSDRLEQAITPSQLHYILTGKTALTLDRFHQLTVALQLDPQKVLHEALHTGPEITYPFSEEQEAVICLSTLNYKIVVACSEPKSIADLKELFNKDSERLDASIGLLLLHDILQELDEGIYRTRHTENIAAMRYSDGLTRIVKSTAGELYDGIYDIVENHPHLIPYIRNLFLVEYLTPEQLRELKKDLFDLKDKVMSFVFHNRSNPDSAKRAKRNLMGIMCLISPLSPSSFLNNPNLRPD